DVRDDVGVRDLPRLILAPHRDGAVLEPLMILVRTCGVAIEGIVEQQDRNQPAAGVVRLLAPREIVADKQHALVAVLVDADDGRRPDVAAVGFHKPCTVARARVSRSKAYNSESLTSMPGPRMPNLLSRVRAQTASIILV